MENKIVVPIGDKKLVVLVQDWHDEMPKEIYICLEDGDNILSQDICMVREHYHYNKNIGEFEIDSSLVDCKVWADSDSEDYTHEFTIGVYKEEE